MFAFLYQYHSIQDVPRSCHMEVKYLYYCRLNILLKEGIIVKKNLQDKCTNTLITPWMLLFSLMGFSTRWHSSLNIPITKDHLYSLDKYLNQNIVRWKNFLSSIKQHFAFICAGVLCSHLHNFSPRR